MTLLVAKVPFGEGASKGVFTICDTQKLCSAENTLFIVFSAQHSCRNERVQVEETEIYQNLGLFANMPKVLFCLLFIFWCFVFFSLFLFFLEKPKKGYFPAILEGYPLLFPPKACLENPSLLPILFFLFFLLSSLSKFHIFLCFLCFLSINPFWRTFSVGLLLSLLSFSFGFPLLRFACFFKTSFPKNPNIPFFKNNLLSCLFSFRLLFFCFHVSWFCFSVLCWFCFWFVFFCYCYVFVMFLVLLSGYETKRGFTCNSSALGVMFVRR